MASEKCIAEIKRIMVSATNTPSKLILCKAVVQCIDTVGQMFQIPREDVLAVVVAISDAMLVENGRHH